jgi:hypothetical protein
LCEKPKHNADGHMNHLDIAPNRSDAPIRSAGFPTCRIADFQVGKALGIPWFAGLETRDTADLEVRATMAVCRGAQFHILGTNFLAFGRFSVY